MESTGWNDGYATDNTYITKFYFELSPEYLNLACVVNGVEPVPLDRPFTYLELGCGYGLSSALLAAGNPHGRFYANDFMPAHVATAESLASAAGLGNLTLLENSFEELAQGKVGLPTFDFITLHGVYTWVSRENRRHIVDIVSRYLKPGGIVYVSYNALPGWASGLALQRLLLSQSAMTAGKDSAERFVQARDFVENLLGTGAKYFEANPSLLHELDGLRKADPVYLVHEYLHSGWEPMYHVDVATDLSRAKMEYVGLATVSVANATLPDAQQRLLGTVPDPSWRETLRDFVINTRFRKDVFVRGGRPLSALRRDERLRRSLMALNVPRDQAAYGFEWGTEAERRAADELLDELAEAPRTLAEVADRPLFGNDLDLVTRMAMLLVDNRSASIFQPERAGLDSGAALRLNRAIADHSRHVDQFAGFASPLTGNGIRVDRIERLVYGELAANPQDTAPEVVAARVRAVLLGQADTAASDLATLEEKVAQVLRTSVPMWRRLKAI